MSMDRSLKSKAALTRHRNVLSRAERIKVLTDEERWGERKSIFGLPKVAHRKANVGAKKKKEKKAEGEAGAEAAPAAATAPAGPAAGKGAAGKAGAGKGAGPRK
jgi:small basic protein (TIGR04137 family)